MLAGKRAGPQATKTVLYQHATAALRPIGSHSLCMLAYHMTAASASQEEPRLAAPTESGQSGLLVEVKAAGWVSAWLCSVAPVHQVVQVVLGSPVATGVPAGHTKSVRIQSQPYTILALRATQTTRATWAPQNMVHFTSTEPAGLPIAHSSQSY